VSSTHRELTARPTARRRPGERYRGATVVNPILGPDGPDGPVVAAEAVPLLFGRSQLRRPACALGPPSRELRNGLRECGTGPTAPGSTRSEESSTSSSSISPSYPGRLDRSVGRTPHHRTAPSKTDPTREEHQ
jgi:hypothetical protein